MRIQTRPPTCLSSLLPLNEPNELIKKLQITPKHSSKKIKIKRLEKSMQLSKETLASFDACLNGKIAPRGNSIIDRMIHRDYVQQQQQQQYVNHERGSKSNLDQSKRKKMIKKKKRQEKRLTKGMTKSKSEPTQLAPPPSFPPPSLSSTQGSGSSINMRNKQKKRLTLRHTTSIIHIFSCEKYEGTR